MAEVKPVRNEADYAAALARVDELMDAEPGTPEGEELEVISALVESYESKHVPMEPPSPIAALEFRMDQAGLAPRDLVPYLGSRAKVSEVLSGKRAITMPMARALHRHLGVPAEALLREPATAAEQSLTDIDWRRFPLKEMVKRQWLSDLPDLARRAEELVGDLMERAGGRGLTPAALYRKNDRLRTNAKTNRYALQAWCWQVLATANRNPPEAKYTPGSVTLEFLRRVARLSCKEDGPRLAREYLAAHGIPLVIERHLPRTHLDGAALRLGDGRPVVALTLRYDRIDGFWFCLLHELAHVGRHLAHDPGATFADDQSLRTANAATEDRREAEADAWAAEALIPRAVWETSAVRVAPTPLAVTSLAQRLQVHPATIAGRVRYERRNYRLLSQFVGSGQVRRQFGLTG